MADKDPTQTASSGTPSSGDPDQTDSNGNPNGNEDKDFDPPQEPTAEETPDVLVAPAAVDPTAVDTVVTPEGEKKVGWQQEPVKPELLKEPCFHTAIVQARKQVPAFEVGHEWVCICGTIFVVHVNRGGKKTLVEKEALVEEPEQIPAGLNVG